MERLMWARPLSQTRAVVIIPVDALPSHRWWGERPSFWEKSPEGAFSITQERQPRYSRARAIQGRVSISEWEDMPSSPGSLHVF